MAENANIRIIIDAIASAAEEALDDVGDEILDLGGDAALAGGRLDEFSDEMNEATASGALLEQALDEVQDSEEKLAATSYLLGRAVDDVGDELTEAAAKSGLASGGFTSLSLSSEGASLSVGALGSSLWLTLIPALLTLSTILAPLAASLAVVTGGALSLAGAFGAIVGSGILAFGEQRARQNRKELEQVNRRISQYELLQDQTGSLTAAQAKNLESLKEQRKELEDGTTAGGALAGVMSDLKAEIAPLIVDFGDDFVPLISDAVDALPSMVDRMFDAVGGTDEFRQALRDFGRVMYDVLPGAIGLMFDLGRDALPVLRDFGSWLMDNGPEAGQAMKESFEEIQPELMDFIDALVDASPTLLEFGTTTAEVVIPAITGLIRAADGFMETVNGLPDPISSVVVGLLAFLPVVVKLAGGINWLVGLLGGSGGLSVSLGGIGTILTGSAGLIAAATAFGGALGLIAVKALDAVGALQKVQKAGADVGKELGPDFTSGLLTSANVASFGGLEGVSKFGVTATAIARGDKDLGASERRQVDRTFEQADRRTKENAQTIIQGGILVDVSNEQDLGRNPYRSSRTFSDQLRREIRSKNGT